LIVSRYVIVQLIAAAVGAYLAGKKGRNWIIWGLLCFVFPLSLIILFFLPRVFATGVTKQCPECGRIIPHDALRCEFCRKDLPIEMVQCPKCGKFVPEGQSCPDCKH